MPHDVFISYSARDKKAADAACAVLEAHGIRCWIAPRDVRAGRPYGDEIIRGIERSRCFILVLSAASNDSAFVAREVEPGGKQEEARVPRARRQC